MKKQRNKDGTFAKGNDLGNRFSKAPQGLDQEKSEGQITSSSKTNIRKCLETKLFERKAVDATVDNAFEELKKGNGAPMRELIKIAKGNETQDISLNGGVEVQRVYIDKETKEAYRKHIYDFINGDSK